MARLEAKAKQQVKYKDKDTNFMKLDETTREVSKPRNTSTPVKEKPCAPLSSSEQENVNTYDFENIPPMTGVKLEEKLSKGEDEQIILSWFWEVKTQDDFWSNVA